MGRPPFAMKTILAIILVTVAALSANAESLGFIKVGESYEIQFPTANPVVLVVSDEGGRLVCL